MPALHGRACGALLPRGASAPLFFSPDTWHVHVQADDLGGLVAELRRVLSIAQPASALAVLVGDSKGASSR